MLPWKNEGEVAHDRLPGSAAEGELTVAGAARRPWVSTGIINDFWSWRFCIVFLGLAPMICCHKLPCWGGRQRRCGTRSHDRAPWRPSTVRHNALYQQPNGLTGRHRRQIRHRDAWPGARLSLHRKTSCFRFRRCWRRGMPHRSTGDHTHELLFGGRRYAYKAGPRGDGGTARTLAPMPPPLNFAEPFHLTFWMRTHR